MPNYFLWLIGELRTLRVDSRKSFTKRYIVRFSPLPLSSVAVALAPHLSLGDEVAATDETRGNPPVRWEPERRFWNKRKWLDCDKTGKRKRQRYSL